MEIILEWKKHNSEYYEITIPLGLFAAGSEISQSLHHYGGKPDIIGSPRIKY